MEVVAVLGRGEGVEHLVREPPKLVRRWLSRRDYSTNCHSVSTVTAVTVGAESSLPYTGSICLIPVSGRFGVKAG